MSSKLINSSLEDMPSLENSNEWKTTLPNRYYLSEELSDIWIIVANGQRIPAHKVFLGLKSEVLGNRFKQWPHLKEFAINGVDIQSIKQMLGFVYTNQYICSQNLLIEMDVWTLAQRLQMSQLLVLVEEGMEQMLQNNNCLNSENFWRFCRFGIKYNICNVWEKTLSFGRLNRISIFESELLRYESKESLEVLIRSLGLTQSQTINSINSVIQKSNRKKEDFEVLIDLNNCSIEDLFCLAKTNLFANENLLERIEKKYNEWKQNSEDFRQNYFEIKQMLEPFAQNLKFRY